MGCRPVAADLVIVKEGKVVLIKRAKEPFKGMWALPGGRLEENETIEECAIREAKEETSLDIELQALIGVYSHPERDPRKVVAVAFLASPIGGTLRASTDALEARWVEIEKALKMELAADHNRILEDALGLYISQDSLR
ncbi:MAG: NUDIX hydrolase [Candidatus Micrarchaeota archaeon]|nr:NUDIX hydrolase [Candidatus Micrarchaeota archaeon]